MRHHRTGVLVLALLAASQLAASPPPKIVAEWNAPKDADAKYGKVLAIGITEDREVRHRFEDKLVSHLRGRDISTVTSYTLVADLLAPGSREEVLQKIEAHKIDAAISFRLVPLESKDETAWDVEWRREADAGGTLRDLVQKTLPVKETKAKFYGVEATLWVTGTPARLWSGRSAPHKIEELRKNAGDFIQNVIETLEYHHWI